jgi:hypothetical protein
VSCYAHLHYVTANDHRISGETIGVQAGDQIFYIHKNLISASSEFFKNATKPEWMNKDKPIDMSDETAHLFKKYCQWLYTKLIPPKEPHENTYKYLARMYVLGEKIIDPAFQNAMVNAMITHHASAKPSQKVPGSKVPGWDSIEIIYKGTTEMAPARRLLVDIWVFNMVPSWDNLDKLKEAKYKPFADDLLRALVEKRGIPDASTARPWKPQPGSYHNKVVIPGTDVSAKKDENAAFEAPNQDEMETLEN